MVSLVLGWMQAGRYRTGHRRRPALLGLAVGAAVWLAPLLQELTGTPGNLSTLWTGAHHTGPRTGLGQALGALGSATRPLPTWLHRPDHATALQTFAGIAGLFSGPRWWGACAVVLTALVAVVAWRASQRRLCAAAATACAVALGTLVALAVVPANQFLVFTYLAVLLWPVGMLVWLLLVWAGLWGSVALGRRLAPGALRPHAGRTVPRWVPAGTVVVLAVVALVSALGAAGTSQSTLSSWRSVRQADAVAARLLRVGPRSSFELAVSPTASFDQFAVMVATAYTMHWHGRPLHFPDDAAVGIRDTPAQVLALPWVMLQFPPGAHGTPVIRRVRPGQSR